MSRGVGRVVGIKTDVGLRFNGLTLLAYLNYALRSPRRPGPQLLVAGPEVVTRMAMMAPMTAVEMTVVAVVAVAVEAA